MPQSAESLEAERGARGRVILLHRQAPAMPGRGQACNGCGVCCAWAPCPLGMLLSRRRRGACAALSWDDGAARYRCGALAAPRAWLPRWLAGWPARGETALRAVVGRWIAAGRGCDAALERVPPND